MIRSEVNRWARDTLRAMRPNETRSLTVPAQQPFNRIAYQCVGAVAHSVFGPGFYRMKGRGGEISVTRLAERVPLLRDRRSVSIRVSASVTPDADLFTEIEAV